MSDDIKIKPSKQEIQKQMAVQFAVQSYFSSFQFGNMSENDIKEMMEDEKIKIKWNLRRLTLCSHEIKIKAKNENDSKAIELQNKFNKIINTNVLKEILDSKLKKYSIQEIIYNSDYTMKEIRKKPNDYFTKMYVMSEEKYKWFYSYSGLQEIEYYKALISENDPDDEFIDGKTELYSLYKLWVTSNNTTEAVNNIVEKYGIPIMWIAYQEGTSDADIESLMDSAAEIKQKSVLAFQRALNGGDNGLNKDFGFVDMSNLKTDVHTQLLKYIDDEYSKYFLGTAGLQEAGTGSYAAKLVDSDIFKIISDSDLKYVEEKLQQLLEIDGYFFGYNSDDYSFVLVERQNPEKIEENRRKEAERLNILLQNYDISEEYISQQQGIPIEYITKKQNTGFGGFGFNREYAKSNNNILKRISDQKNQINIFNDSIDSVKKKVNKALSDNMKEAINNIKKLDDIKNISLTFPKEFLDMYILSFLKGQLNVYNSSQKCMKEFAEEVDIFNMTYDDAIKYLQNKIPFLYDDLDDITEEMTERYFWVKKSTTLELTKKIQKSLINSLKDGKSFADWKQEVSNEFGKMGIDASGSYIENVYRTNMQNNYSAGRYVRQESQKQNFPYWQFFAIDDDVTTDICRELDGKIYRADDPIWNKIYPPLNYNCRSTVIALSDYDIEDMQIEASQSGNTIEIGSPEHLKEMQVFKDFETTSFSGNPYKGFLEESKARVKDKENKINENEKVILKLIG